MPTALLSVYDKTGISALATELHELGWTLVSSGGTAKAVAAGEGVTILGNGSIVAGHVLTALNYGDRLYLSDTAGKVASTSAEGTTKVTVGREIAGLASTTYDKLVLVQIEHVVTTG